MNALPLTIASCACGFSQAPPVGGKANDALLRWLANTLGLKKQDVMLISGQTSRDKRVRLQKIKATDVQVALGLADSLR